MSERTQRDQLESIVVDYIERYGMTTKARQYFRRLNIEMPDETRLKLERPSDQNGSA